MSYITYQVKCSRCGEIYNTAFGIVGTTLIADPLKKCPTCGGAVKKCAEDFTRPEPATPAEPFPAPRETPNKKKRR